MKDLHLPLRSPLFALEMNFDPTDEVTFDLTFAPPTGHEVQVTFG